MSEFHRERLGSAAFAFVFTVAGIVFVFAFAAATAIRAEPQTALEVRSLSFEEARSGLPAGLTGVVTFFDPPDTVFVQDETAGTFFRLGGAAPPQPGDLVRVRGKTETGLYLPGIRYASFEILSHRSLPDPLPVDYADLTSGRYHYQRVAIEGVVRTVAPDGEGAGLVRVALGPQVIEARVEQPLRMERDAALVDAAVRVSGLAAGHINDRRQLVVPFLRCRNWSEFEVLETAPAPESLPRASPEQLLAFDVAGQAGHRLRLRGTVLAAFPGGKIFLRDEETAFGVLALSPRPAVAAGDQVEVIGFPEMERFSAWLVDARVIDQNGATGPPEAVEATPADLMKGHHDGDLVAVAAEVSDSYRTKAGGVLVLQEGGRTLSARVPGRSGDAFPVGARLRVTGICQVESASGSQAQYRSEPESISLLVRSASDIVFLRAPSWWTSRRLAITLIVLLVAVLLAALWIALLRRQVEHQTAALRHRIESEAALEERQRIAREFHDTLEQELAGLSLRLDAATTRQPDEKLRGFLDGSRSLVSRIQAETRNLVSDLRDSSSETAGLEASLRDLVARFPPGIGPEILLETPQPPALAALPRRTVHHLRMIAREAVTNALKHSGADRIGLAVAIENRKDAGEDLVMRIADDGRGFDVEKDTRGRTGHFGCMGIRERCRRLGAEVSWRSRPGEGSAVEVRLPLRSAIREEEKKRS